MPTIAPLRFAIVASILLALAPAHAQGFPDQPIRVIVPTQAGGMADILSRVFAQKVKEQSGASSKTRPAPMVCWRQTMSRSRQQAA